MLGHGLLVFHGNQGAVVDAAGALPCPSARRPEPVVERPLRHGGHVAHGAQAEALEAGLHFEGDGQQVYRVGREEGPDVLGDLACAERLGGPGGDEGRELGVRHADARGQVGGDGVQQGADDPGLPSVEPLQTVHLYVGGPKLRALDTVADRLKGGEHPAEDLAVGGLVGFDDDGVGVARQRLLQRHARGHAGGGREEVDDHGPAARAVDDDGGLAVEVRLPPQLDLRPQVRDEHAGDPHDASSVAKSRNDRAEDDRERTFSLSKGR